MATRTGWAVVAERYNRQANDPDLIVLHSGIILLPPTYSQSEQLAYFGSEAQRVISKAGRLDLVVYERAPITWKGANVVALQYQLYGVLLSACAMLGYQFPIEGVSPTRWQMDVLGIRSNRTRLKKQAMLQAKMRTGFCTTDEDLADAVCQACWGMGTVRLGMVGVAG